MLQKPRVLLDANILYGQTLRDTFMHLAANDVVGLILFFKALIQKCRYTA